MSALLLVFIKKQNISQTILNESIGEYKKGSLIMKMWLSFLSSKMTKSIPVLMTTAS